MKVFTVHRVADLKTCRAELLSIFCPICQVPAVPAAPRATFCATALASTSDSATAWGFCRATLVSSVVPLTFVNAKLVQIYNSNFTMVIGDISRVNGVSKSTDNWGAPP